MWPEFLHFLYSHGPPANLLELCRLQLGLVMRICWRSTLVPWDVCEIFAKFLPSPLAIQLTYNVARANCHQFRYNVDFCSYMKQFASCCSTIVPRCPYECTASPQLDVVSRYSRRFTQTREYIMWRWLSRQNNSTSQPSSSKSTIQLLYLLLLNYIMALSRDSRAQRLQKLFDASATPSQLRLPPQIARHGCLG